MSVPVELALPCRLLTLKVRVGPEAGVTTLEDLVARAVLAGKDTVTGQAKLFAIPERIVVDVVHSLWMKGHVVVDFDEGRLGLSDGAREILSSTESLADSAAELQPRKFLFEPVTGTFYDWRDGTPRPREGSLELPLRQGIDEGSLPKDELIRAVQAAIRRDRRNGFRSNVLDVGFGSPVLREPTQLRWLHVHVEVREDQDSNRVSVELAEQRWWEEQARRRLSGYLADLADSEPDHPFVHRLRGRATVSLAPPERAERLLQQLEEKLDGLGETPLPQVEGRQQELARLARRIQGRLVAVDQTRAQATVVNGAGHWWVVEDLVRSAEHQLLLAAPMIDYRPLNQLLPALRDRLDHGVQLVVLWGRNGADSLPDRVATALYGLARSYGPRVLVGERSATSEACLIVQDDRRALVGSHSPLAAEQPDEKHEVSVLIERAEHGPNPPQAVTELLFWARETFPNWMAGQRIMVHRGDFGATGTDGSEPRVAEQPLPSIDRRTMDADVVRLWAATWADYHAALVDAKARAEEVGPTIEAIRDGEHRDGLWEGLRTATRRLVVADDRIDPAVADERLAKAVRARADAGAAVWLAHPSLRRTGNGQESFVAPAGGTRSVQVLMRPSGGRLVVTDDTVLVGSYSPLGTDESRARYAGSRRHQLGLRIQGEGFAREVVARLGVKFGPRGGVDRAPAAGPVASRRARSRAGATAALGLLLEARGPRGGTDFGPWVAARLRDLDDPSEVLDTWHRNGVPSRELRPVVASLLRQGDPTDPVERERWVRWLVVDAWQRRSFVEAAVVARLLPDRSGALASASSATRAIELGPVGAAVSDAALELSEHPVDPQLAAGAGALAELLLWSGGEGAEALSLLSLPGAWKGLAEEALALPTTVSGPVPLDLLSAEFARSIDLASLEGRRAALVAEIDKIERLRQRFDFPTGKALHDGLLAPDGLLTTIRAAAAGGTAESERLQSVLPANVQRHLDDVIDRAGEERMAWYRQGAYLRQIEEIVRSARTLVAAEVAAGADLSLHGYERIAVRAADTWDQLFSEATAISPPYELPVVALLDKLSPLAWWARERT